MSTNDIVIRPVTAGDEPAWRLLNAAYAAFYKMPMSDRTLTEVFAWLMDPGHVLEGLVMAQDDTLVGLAHFRAIPSPLRGADVGFLDDLFVSPDARGSRLGEAMLSRLKGVTSQRGWPFVRWHTADENYRARTLYDRVAHKTSWNVYEMETGL
ncbi:MAG: GNAT family N-acetyltransferase [Proteobacteria bacterium]|nr:GNAT family N-acetyltransferase [Pseudomonadota bacterium]